VHGVKEILDFVDKKAAALGLFEEYGTNMGHFLAPWIRKFDARVMVIGGNITGAYAYFGQHLENAFREQGLQVDILISDLKEDAAVIGGARLIIDEYYQKVKELLSLM
jgi:glucokinase